MLVTGSHLAKYLRLTPQRITQLRLENKIFYKSKRRKLYNLEQAMIDYDQNTCPGKVLRHQADKLGNWGIYQDDY
jgi:hypothetical protein